MIPDITPVNNQEGNGYATTFDFKFLIEDKSQLAVFHTDSNGLQVKLTYEIDYTINEFKNPKGSFITFPIQGSSYGVLPEGEIISLCLDLPISQEKGYGTSEDLDLKTIEDSFDYLTRLVQIQARQLQRSVKIQEGSSMSPDELVQSIRESEANSADFARKALSEANRAKQISDAFDENAKLKIDEATVEAKRAKAEADRAEEYANSINPQEVINTAKQTSSSLLSGPVGPDGKSLILKILDDNTVGFEGLEDNPVVANSASGKTFSHGYLESLEIEQTRYEYLVPIMTSNNTPEGYAIEATAYATSTPPHRLFDRTTSVFCGDTNQNKTTITITLSEPKVLDRYSIMARSDYPGQAPQSWTLLGSNDKEKWDVLDTQSGLTSWGASELKAFKAKNDRGYKYYRLLDLLAGPNAAANTFGLAQINLFGRSSEGTIYFDETQNITITPEGRRIVGDILPPQFIHPTNARIGDIYFNPMLRNAFERISKTDNINNDFKEIDDVRLGSATFKDGVIVEVETAEYDVNDYFDRLNWQKAFPGYSRKISKPTAVTGWTADYTGWVFIDRHVTNTGLNVYINGDLVLPFGITNGVSSQDTLPFPVSIGDVVTYSAPVNSCYLVVCKGEQ